MLFMSSGGRPALRCATCDHAIFKASEAAVVYPSGIESGQMYRVAVTHKGACLAQAIELMDNDHGSAMWMELEEFGTRLREGRGVASA